MSATFIIRYRRHTSRSKSNRKSTEAAERQLASMKNIRYKAAVHRNNFDQLLDDCYLLRVKVLKRMPESTRISGMLNKYPCWRKDPVLIVTEASRGLSMEPDLYEIGCERANALMADLNGILLSSGILKIPRKSESEFTRVKKTMESIGGWLNGGDICYYIEATTVIIMTAHVQNYTVYTLVFLGTIVSYILINN